MYSLCMLGSHKDHRRAQSGALLATYGLHRTVPQIQRTWWEITYRYTVVGVDVSAILVSIGLRQWWGSAPGNAALTPILAVAATLLWISALVMNRAWDSRVLGQGSQEFNRLFRALGFSTVVLALVALGLQLAELRPWVFGVLPVACLLTVVGRYILRQRLHHRRAKGECLHQVLAIGTEDAIADLISRTRRDPYTGWTVAAACTPTGAGTDGDNSVLGVPVVGDLDSAASAQRNGGFRAVAVAAAPGWTPKRLHQLSWDLEGTGAELVVDPGLMDVTGPRLHVASVDGFPLLRLTAPDFTSTSFLIKRALDGVGAVLLVVVLAPLFIAIAVAVKSDGGPVFFRQTRVGRHGREFQMVKFRSMVVDAETRRAELMPRNDSDGPLFKLRYDPRITRIGAILRRYSLDELPQLFNILTGSMSLVGPRPPLPSELRSYTRDAYRKLLVRPGLTGLWQVSGRSDLSWEQSVRLDLRYVENWTLATDLLILWKTVRTVVTGAGAY